MKQSTVVVIVGGDVEVVGISFNLLRAKHPAM